MPLYVKNKNRKTVLTSLIFALAIGMLVSGWFDLRPIFAQSVSNNSIQQISLSASLFNNENHIIPNGEYEIRFGIYSKDRDTADPYPSNADAGNRLWEETQKVEVKNGIFRVFLGTTTPLSETLNFESGDYYIGMRIGDDSEMTPRKKLGSVPRAVNSQFLQGKTIGTQSGNIPVLENKGKLNIKNLPTGTGDKQLVLGNDERLKPDSNSHKQNTDTGTDSEIFNIGSNTTISGTNFDLTVSNSSASPALRYNGTTQVWQFSNNGVIFADISSGSSGSFLPLVGGTMTGSIAFTAGQTFGGATLTELGYLSGVTSSVQTQLDSKSNLSHTHSADDIVSGTLSILRGGTGASTLNNLITLGTHTTGNYVATITEGNGIAGSSSTEGGTPIIALDILDSIDGTGSTTSNSGLEFVGAGSNELSILQGCANGQGIAWNDTTNVWECMSFASGLSGTGTTGYVTYWSGASSLGSEAQLNVSRGGTGVNGAAAGNGTLLIGNGSGYTLATLTDGTGVSISEGAGTITIAATLGTSIEGSEITDGTIEEADLEATNSPTNAYILSYDSATGGFTWIDNTGGSGSSKWTDSGTITYLTSATDDLAVGGSTSLASRFFFDVTTGNQIILEGTGVDDTFETTLVFTNPTADRTLTFPNLTGTVVTTGDTGTVTNTMLAGSIAASKLVGTDIATVGTITAGTWNGTAIGAQWGGTGVNGAAAGNGTLLIGNGSGYTLATLTDGTGVSISEGAGTITIAATLGTSIEGSEITDGTIEEADLEATNSPTNAYILSYDSATGGFTWIDNTGGTGSSKWTDSGTITYLTSATDDLAVGGSTSLASRFFFDVTTGNQIILEGTGVDDTFETTLVFTNPTADRTLTFPNLTGTVVTTGDTGTVTNTMLAGSIAASKLVGTDIATVGTITAGTWNGTAIGAQWGGTGVNGAAAGNGTLLIGNGSGYTLATLTDGTGVSISEGAGTITIAATLGTSIEGSEITDGTIEEADLEATNSPTNAYILSYDSATGGFTWIDNTGGSGSSKWTDSGTITYLTSATDDLAVGGSTSLASRFFFDVTTGNQIILEGTGVDDTFETTLVFTNPTADRTLTFPNLTGTVVTTGDTGSVTNTMLAGSIAASKLVGTDIATVGTITAGTWNGTAIGAQWGGTGVNGAAAGNGTLLIGNGSGYTLATLTDGTGVSISEGAGTITIAATLGTSIEGSEITADSLDFTEFEDTLDLDANLTLNQTSYTWAQDFTGTTTTGLTYTANSLTSGKALNLSNTNTGMSSAFTGDLANLSLTQTYTGGVGLDSTGNLFDISRSITLNNVGNTLTVSGAIATIADSATQTAGTLTHTADVLRISQGYASNSGAALDVTTAGTGLALRVNDDGTFTDSTPFVIDASGNVGIGTTAPGQKLEVAGNILSTGSSAFGSGGSIKNYVTLDIGPTSGSGDGGNWYLLNSEGTANAAITTGFHGVRSRPTTANSAFTVGNVYMFYGDISKGAASTITNAYGLYLENINQGSTNNYAIYSVGGTNYFGGNVGIGDTTPAAMLTVGSGDLFQVNSSGAIAAATGLTTTGNITISGAQILGGSPMIFEGTTDDDITTIFAFTDPTSSNKTITFPNETGTVCTTGSVCSGYQASGSYANTALSNLASVAINTSLISDTNNTDDLGSDAIRWRDLFLGPNTLHIGTSTTDEGTISYNTTGNILNFGTDTTSNADIAFFTDDLYLDKSTGSIGIGTATPSAGNILHVAGQCVTADTRLRRRRRKKKGEHCDPEKEEWEDDEYIYDLPMIKDIRTDDDVRSLDMSSGLLEWKKVNGIIYTGIQDLIRITTQSGRSIRTTAVHPYFMRVSHKGALVQQQKLYRFEVDQSVRFDEYSRDTMIAIANKEQSFVITIPKAAKQALRDAVHGMDYRKELASAMFGNAIALLSRASDLRMHELVIDTEYTGSVHESIITAILKGLDPKLKVSFTQIGKKSPAHKAAYGAFIGRRASDMIAQADTLIAQMEIIFNGKTSNFLLSALRKILWESGVMESIKTENALRIALYGHKYPAHHNPQASSCNDRIDHAKRFVKDGAWVYAENIKVGQKIAVAYGDIVVWEKVVNMEHLPAESVYDVEIDGTHNFVANDIVAHNTYISGNVGIGTASPATRLAIQGTTATDLPTYGSEKLTSAGWTVNAGWTESPDDTFAHTGGGGTATLTHSATIASATKYQISWTVTGRTAGSFDISIGGESYSDETSTGSFGPTTSSTAAFTITPTTDFDGTISLTSLKQITGTSVAVADFLTSLGNSRFQIRASSADSNDTFIGRDAGSYNTTGTNNSAVGSEALYYNTTGSSNTAIGAIALFSNTTGYYNTAVGRAALLYNTTGYYNTAMGYYALNDNTTGYSNSAFGIWALSANTTGYHNNAFGYNALGSNTEGFYNTAMGRSALSANTTADESVAIGYSAAYYTQTGGANTVVGAYAGYGVSGNSYSGNSLFGASAGGGLTTGSNNILLGYAAGDNLTTGANNILIGYDIDAQSSTGSSQLSIGNLIFATGGFGTGTTVGTGNVGIGDASPDHLLDVAGNIGLNASSYINFGDTDGTSGYGFRDNAGAMEFKNSAGSWAAVGSGGSYANMALSNLASVAINTSLISDTNNTDDLGSDAIRWKDLYLGSTTLHIGSSTTDEGTISYDTTGNIFNFSTDATANGDIAFFTDDLYLDKSTGYVGIGTITPGVPLDVSGGNIRTNNQLVSTIATGTAPLAVTSTTKVANLNADLLDGFDSSAFGDATAANQTTILSRIGTNSDSASMSSSLFAGQQYIVDKMANGVKMMSAEAASTYTHANAAKYCYDLSAAAAVDMGGDTSTTFTDWRLPTAEEAAVFEGTITDTSYVWTATVSTAGDLWVFVRLSDGYWDNYYSSSSTYVRCVR